MNYRAIVHYLGLVLKMGAIFMLIPTAISFYSNEMLVVRAFLVTLIPMLIIGLVIDAVRRGDRNIYVRDGFILVAICWICISLFGALPYWVSGAIPSFPDALFESVSGFSTTGATILTNVESMPMGLLFWRSFSHWIGGMGVLVFLLAVVQAKSNEHTVHVLKAESSGPSPGKLVPRLRQSAKILYSIYFALTLLTVFFLLIGGMPLFDTVCHAMSIVGTGGFSVKNASIAAYGSLYLEVVSTVFMILCGINFNIYYFVLARNFKAIWRNDEFKAYLGIIFGSIALITWNLTALSVYGTAGQSLRHASFQVGSVITTTGFATADYSLWPTLSKVVLFFLMICGASAGSTGGGLKVCRVVILAKETKRILVRMAHPRAVGIVKLDGKAVESRMVHSVSSYFFTLLLLASGSLLIVSLDNFDFETTLTAVLTCVGNVGPGYGMVSAVGNFSEFSALSKIVLSMNMLIGRLEIYPILLLFAPRTWRGI